jgi:hypothetical protein
VAEGRREERAVTDLVLVLLTATSFAATYGLAVLCDRI